MPPMRNKRTGGKREKADFKSFGKLLAYCKGYLPAIIAAILLAVGGAVCTIIGPDKISDLTNTLKDGLKTGIDMSVVIDICVSLVIIYGVGAILSLPWPPRDRAGRGKYLFSSPPARASTLFWIMNRRRL